MARDDPAIDFRRLRRSSSTAALGEGLVAVALPLVAAALTRDPLAVAGVFAVQHLAWLVAGLAGPRLFGAADRRTTVGAVNTGRALAVGGLGALVAADGVRLGHLLAVAFVVGLGEVLGDDGDVAGADSLAGPAGPTELMGAVGSRAMVLLGVGLAAGGLLYDVLAAIPLVVNVAVFSLAALWALAVQRRLVPATRGAPGSALGVLADVRPALPPGTRLPALVAGLTAAGSGAVVGVLVLFALDDLGLGPAGFGLLVTAMAGGTVAGGLIAPELGRFLEFRFALAAALIVAGVGFVAAGQLAASDAWMSSATSLVIAAGAVAAAGVLVRVVFHTRPGRPPEPSARRGLQLASWAGTPLGALAGGLAGGALGVGGAIRGVGAGLVVVAVLAAVGTRRLPAPTPAPPLPATATRPVSPA